MSQNNLISIIIATYEMKGNGKNFLTQAFESIKFQTYKNIEVVVSDHSINDEIKKVCLDYNKILNIKYIKNENNIGSSSANFNNGIKYSNGSIIKILMQDDFFYKNHAVSDIVNTFNYDPNIYWIANGCVYGENLFSIKGKMIPFYTDDIHLGNNRIGSPSVISFKKSCEIFFDEKLIWMMDCDLYKNFYKKYGKPFILNDYLVFITQGPHQLTHLLDDARKKEEEMYIKNRYET